MFPIALSVYADVPFILVFEKKYLILCSIIYSLSNSANHIIYTPLAVTIPVIPATVSNFPVPRF
jgi:hypothetical protein